MGSLLSKNNNSQSEEQQVSSQTAPVSPGPGVPGNTADDKQAEAVADVQSHVESEQVVSAAEKCEEQKKTDETETKVNCHETSCEPQPQQQQQEAFDDTTFAAPEESKVEVQAAEETETAIAAGEAEVVEEAVNEEQVEKGCDGCEEPEKIGESVSNGHEECEQEQVEEVKDEEVPAEVQLSTSDLKVEVSDVAAAEADLMSQDDVTATPPEQPVEIGTVSEPEQAAPVDVEKTVDEIEAKTKDVDIGAVESLETVSTEVTQQ